MNDIVVNQMIHMTFILYIEKTTDEVGCLNTLMNSLNDVILRDN